MVTSVRAWNKCAESSWVTVVPGPWVILKCDGDNDDDDGDDDDDADHCEL